VISELTAGGALQRGYVYLGGEMLAIQQSNQVSWVHQDPVTKSQRITNSNGAVTSTIDLDPWGGETSRSSNHAFQPRRYTSYERDGNGGDEAMMRRYTGKWHRFAQPDPYDGSYDLTNPQSFNRYAYVQNDPVNFVDPLGLDPAGALGAELGNLLNIGPSTSTVTINIGGGPDLILGDAHAQLVYIHELSLTPRGGPQSPKTPEDFRRDTFAEFAADINRCIREIFGKSAKKIPIQTLDIAPGLDVTVNGRELAKRSSMAGKLRSVMAIPDPKKGSHGTVFIQSGAWNYPGYPVDVLQGAYIHEYGNLLAYKYGGRDFYKFGDKAGVGNGKDTDTGANFQRCVFPSSVKF
jgi:RHS repeat-associated protein